MRITKRSTGRNTGQQLVAEGALDGRVCPATSKVSADLYHTNKQGTTHRFTCEVSTEELLYMLGKATESATKSPEAKALGAGALATLRALLLPGGSTHPSKLTAPLAYDNLP